MQKSILYIICFLFTTQNTLIAQSRNSAGSAASEKEVKQVIQNMFTAMKTSDTNLLKTCFSSTSILQTIANKNGVIEIKNQSLQDFINSIGKQSSGALDERIVMDKLLIDDRLASVWTPYQFYYRKIIHLLPFFRIYYKGVKR